MQPIYVYRSNKQSGSYLFLPEKNKFEKIPEELLKLLGELQFSFQFDLESNKKLIRGNASDVLKSLKEIGYFLQISPKKEASKQDKLAKFYRR